MRSKTVPVTWASGSCVAFSTGKMPVSRVIISAILLLLVGLNSPAARGQDTSALINEQLDKPVAKLELNGTLPAVMNTIGEQTGVKLEASPAVWDLLPWGQGTNINAKIENQTLRQALEAITRKLGLVFVLKDQSVELRPMPALRRLGKRATIQELKALDLLTATPLAANTDHLPAHQLLEAVDQKLVDLKSDFAIENRSGESVKPDQVIPLSRNASLADALESLTNATGATWYPWGKSIVVVPKEDQVRNQLLKNISVRYNGTDISQVLMELSQKAGINFDMQPGAVQNVPPEFRSVRLVLDNATIKQALDTISGFTGLGYSVNDKGVYIFNSSSAAGAPREPTVGLIPLDNGMQIVVKESQIPPDMREYLKLKTQKQLQKIRQQMKEENFKPTTQPTGNESL
jgi:hypothetical protein